MSRSFLEASIPDLVQRLTIDEKISLLGAPNWWNTTPIDRLEIPSVRMSDGPNGVRGSSHFVSTPAQCIPCATSLASTFDPELVYKVGQFLGQEAKIKSSVILLAPTCNIQRSPLGGRAFESFSEDPHLSGTLAAAYVNGLQSEGVAATIKHFVANDQEHERTAAESVMSDRALREIYLYPFMLAQKLAKPWAYMTAYGRLMGIHCSENPELLNDILRNEWGFQGIIMSDWFGTYGVDQPINAGLDLEMPGPPRWRTPLLINHCLSAQKLNVPTIDARITTLLTFIQKLARRSPEVVYGDGFERTRDSPEGRKFCRRLAADGMVLLKNDDGVLPVTLDKVRRLAVVGPGAKERVISGGGSAALKASYIVTPWEGIVNNAPEGFVIDYEVGCYANKFLPTLENNLTTPTGEPGWLCTFYNHDDAGNPSGPLTPVADFILQDTRVKLNDFLPPGLTPTWSIKLRGVLIVDKTAPFELGLTVAGRAKLWIDGKLTIDNWTKHRPGEFFYGQGTMEEKATINLTAGSPVDVLVEYTNTSPPDVDEHSEKRNSQPALMRGVRLGGCEKIDPDKAIEAAVALVTRSDAVLYIGGLTPDWESEGFDRPSLALPGRQDELISRLGRANPNTVVVIQAGSAVSMPWVNDVSGIIQAWYSGNEAGNALADIVYGTVNPSGRLPLTLPVRMEDVPSFLNLRSENGKIHYREDLFVGYKHYIARGVKPLFAFGFGLSYTSFSFSGLEVTTTAASSKDDIRVEVFVTVKNEGPVSGASVAQLYITYPNIGLITTPALQLKGFAKTHDLPPGETQKVSMILDRYAVSFWDVSKNVWRAEAGTYGVSVGSCCEDLVLGGEFVVGESFEWKGI